MQQKRTINCMHSKNNCFENPASQCRRLQILIYKKYMQKKHSKFIIINNVKNMNLSNLKGVLPKGKFFLFLGNFFVGNFFNFFWENFPFFWKFFLFWETVFWENFLFFWENFSFFWGTFLIYAVILCILNPRY
jgi:cellulose synthase/poly-beta-1,6-N-acetylglucosamine synthase-like glycosyltransferase